jgi:hypothetical protein
MLVLLKDQCCGAAPNPPHKHSPKHSQRPIAPAFRAGIDHHDSPTMKSKMVKKCKFFLFWRVKLEEVKNKKIKKLLVDILIN